MAPSSILAAGAGTAAAVLVGAPLAVAVLLGGAVYASVVGIRMPKGRRSGPGGQIDLHLLRGQWRWYVHEALDSRKRFSKAIQGAGSGPIRQRLEGIGERIDDGVMESWRIANRGQELEAALAQLTPADQVESRLQELRSQPGSETTARLVEALEAQAATYQRIASTAGEAGNRLQILEARLDEAVARAVELSLRAGDVGELGGLDADVDSLVTEMEALRRGLDEAAGQTAVG